MEAAATTQLSQGLQLGLPSPGIPGLDVVRALHQSVVSLRAALDSSREELRRLKESIGDFNGETYLDTVERLALENHVLRRKILDGKSEFLRDADGIGINPPSSLNKRFTAVADETKGSLTKKYENSMDPTGEDADKQGASQLKNQEDMENMSQAVAEDHDVRATWEAAVDHLELPDRDQEDFSSKSISDGENSVSGDHPENPANISEHRDNPPDSKPSGESENDSEELDDIELIFTTDETRDVGLQEDLVSITESEVWPLPRHRQTDGQPVLLKYTKTSDPESLVNGDKTSSSVEEAASSQSSSIDREESVDRFDEGSGARLNKMWSQCSVLVETDISKCGVLEEPDPARYAARRNTLAAPPTAYRPIIHREALASGRRKSATPLRPVMDRSSGGSRRESGAQTDISALPAQWRSESYLAHKVAHTFTTLPSKFALPAGIPGRLRLSDKTREARRVMLSDISFTSMVPELSRSADHLCHDPHAQTCLNARGCGPRTPEVHRRESLGSLAGYFPRCHAGTGLPSPCDCRLSTDLYSSRYRGSLTSIPSPGLEVTVGSSRRHSWRATAASFDTWRMPMATSTPRPTWSSMPSSPTHVHPPLITGASSSRTSSKNLPKRTRSKVTFQDCPVTRGSLPNLRSDSIGADNSGDSTESLIDEAEDYLRRSIDSMLTITGSEYFNRHTTSRRRRARRHSEPELLREWNPPQDARPYLPKIPRDLKLNHLVKIISPEGRVLQGKVRYIGPVPGREEPHVGVELPTDSGSSDGTFHGRRFFDWWCMRIKSLKTLRSTINYEAALSFFESMGTDKTIDSSASAKASGFLRHLEGFDFLFLLTCTIVILERVEILNAELQRSDLSVNESHQKITLVIESLQELRISGFEIVWETATVDAEHLCLEKPQLPRVRRAVQRLITDDRNSSHTFASPEEYFRKKFFEIIDQVLTSMKDRFSSATMQLLNKFEDFAVGRESSAEVATSFYQKIQHENGNSVVQADFDAEQLTLHQKMFLDIASQRNLSLNSLKDVVSFFRENSSIGNLLPEFLKLLRIILTIPASSCTAERSFSALRRMKTYLRSTMLQSRLNHLAILHIHAEIVEEIRRDLIIDEFISRNVVRKATFALLGKSKDA